MYGIIVALLGIIGMTGEYRHGTITSTLLVTPSREQMVAAKVAVYGLAGLGLGLLSSTLTLAVALPGLAARNVDLALTPGDVAAILVGGLLYFALSGVFGVGVGAVVRNQIAALAAVLVLFFIVESVLVRLSPEVARWLPGQAGSALYFPGPAAPQGTGLGATVLRQPIGGVVFAAYAAVLCLAGVVVTRSRDIT
jgi:ABC-2 type transport system permease protein